MSLLHRVSSLESFSSGKRGSVASIHSQNGGSSPFHTQGGRRLSYNPLPPSWDPPRDDDHIHDLSAVEVPKFRRICKLRKEIQLPDSANIRTVQVGIAVIYCLFAAGIVFGYAAIKPVLIAEGVYRSQCTEEELQKDVRVCYKQEIHLNLMFTVAAVGTNVAALPIGAILDRYGPRVCGVISSVLLMIGALLFAFAWDLPFDAYIMGYLFLALGGPFCFISSFQLSNAFPNRSGLILALLTGAFDTSSALFLIYRLIYQWSEGKFWPKYFFLIYLVVPVFILIVQLFIMPKYSYKTLGEIVTEVEEEREDSIAEDQLTEDEALLREERRQHRASVVSEITSLLGTKAGAKLARQEERMQARSGVFGAMHGKTVAQQVFSPWFILITLFTVIQMTRINYFVATIRAQYEVIFGSYETAVEINNFFDVALPLGGVVAIPFIGTILDKTSTVFVLSCLVAIATTIGVLGCLPYEWAAYANICLFVVYRPFYYTTVSDYAAKVFGFETFGTVYGLIICLAGLFNFSQSGLDALLHKVFNGNPIPVNIGLCVAALIVGCCLVGFVAYKAYGKKTDALRHEAEDADEEIMPGAISPERL